MARSFPARPRPSRRFRHEDPRADTRRALLEAAGRTFAEKGFERSTAKEICARAHTNGAAVNYYFGGIEGLYDAVLDEARSSVFSDQAIETAIVGKTGARAKLEAVYAAVIQTLLGPVSKSWVLRVLARDMVAPTLASGASRDDLVLPRARILRRFVAEVMGLPESHPDTARGCVSVMAPFCMLVLADRDHLRQALPGIGLGAGDSPDMARHMAEFALAGLRAAGRRARHPEPRVNIQN